MKLSNATILAVAALPLGGCHGAFWGNLVVLGVTVGIFFATLSLGKAGVGTVRSTDGSASGSSRTGS